MIKSNQTKLKLCSKHSQNNKRKEFLQKIKLKEFVRYDGWGLLKTHTEMHGKIERKFGIGLSNRNVCAYICMRVMCCICLCVFGVSDFDFRLKKINFVYG